MNQADDPRFQALTPQQAAMEGASSLTRYGSLFFPRTFRQRSPEFHERIGQELYSPARFNAFEIFRDGAKTTLLRTYTSQRIAYGISRTIMYVSVSQQHAVFSVRWIKRQIEHNKKWAQTFGLRKGTKWTDEWIEIIHDLEETPITMLAMGITGQIRGFNPDDFRPDLIVVDDILNEENTATPEQRQKIEALLFGALLNSLSPATESPLAKAVFLQTPFNKQDAIEACMKDPQWNPLKFGLLDEHGQSRWPERYPTEKVMEDKAAHIRRSQYRLWMREKECTIVAGEEKAIDVTKFKTYDVLPESMDVVISIDPASSEEDTADEQAIVALGFKGQEVYVLDYAAAKGQMPDKLANDFFNLTLLYGPRKGVVEANAYQRTLKWFLEQEMTKRRIYVALSLLEVRTKNADRIMQSIPALAAYGHFWIRAGMSKLIQQADDYDPAVKNIADDLLTAIANGIVDSNPAIRSALVHDPETGGVIFDESEFQPLRIGGCP